MLTAIFIIFSVSSKIFLGIPVTIFNDEPIMKNFKDYLSKMSVRRQVNKYNNPVSTACRASKCIQNGAGQSTATRSSSDDQVVGRSACSTDPDSRPISASSGLEDTGQVTPMILHLSFSPVRYQ